MTDNLTKLEKSVLDRMKAGAELTLFPELGWFNRTRRARVDGKSLRITSFDKFVRLGLIVRKTGPLYEALTETWTAASS